MSKGTNVEVFKDTEKQCKTNERLKQSIAKSTAEQKIYLETHQLPELNKEKFPDSAKITITKNRTFQAAKKYRGNKVAVLNFANPRYPGGSVANGSAAQEEALCRCSGLYFNLNTEEMKTGFYEPHKKNYNPLHNDDLIYTPGVTVFKSDTSKPELLPEKDWQQVDVISCSAPRLGGTQGNLSKDKLLALHEKRLRRILDAALDNGADTVVLGAFGCGVYNNPPDIVAQACKNVLKDYKHAFKNIEVAVYCTKKDERNFNAYTDAFEEEIDAGTVTAIRDPEKDGLTEHVPTQAETEMDFACSVKQQQALLEDFSGKLNALKNKLETEGKKSEDRSFEDDVKNSSDSYKKLTKCLADTAEILKNKNATIQDIRRSMYTLYMAGLDYYNGHVGAIGPISDYGGARLNVSEELTKLIPNVFNAEAYLGGCLSTLKDENGLPYSSRPLSEIEAKAASLRENMSAADQDRLDNHIKPYSVKDLLMVSQKQMDFRKKVKKISKTFAADYDFSKKPDKYLKLKPNMSMTDKAKYYLLKELYDEVYKPGRPYEEVSAVVSKFNAAKFTENVKKLAADPAFQRCVKTHPDTAFSSWKQQARGKAPEDLLKADQQLLLS